MTPERKVVVITGASRGIGAQLSKAYSAHPCEEMTDAEAQP
jgi:NAD(P)-dependent dehydrogenase (short-subunit alcohol dehydrogenase family)